MISSYLERPLRTLAQALEDRTRRGGPNIIGPDSVEQLVRLLTENTNRHGAIEAPAAARQRSSLGRRRAA